MHPARQMRAFVELARQGLRKADIAVHFWAEWGACAQAAQAAAGGESHQGKRKGEVIESLKRIFAGDYRADDGGATRMPPVFQALIGPHLGGPISVWDAGR